MKRRLREQTPLQRALGLLVRREHSRRELTRKLASRGIDGADAAVAIDKLAQDGWQNDARFAQTLTRARASQGYGPLRIRAELATHGLDQDTIQRVLAEFDGDWTDTARELAHRRYGPAVVEDPALRRKAADFLVRRGFTSGQRRAAVDPEGVE